MLVVDWFDGLVVNVYDIMFFFFVVFGFEFRFYMVEYRLILRCFFIIIYVWCYIFIYF